MEQIKHKIQLSFGSSDVKRTVIKQNSNESHTLLITLYDKNNLLTISPDWIITISGTKADGTYILNQNPITMVDNVIEVQMTQQMLSAPGTSKFELIIQDGETVLYSDTFLIYVEPNVQDGSGIESLDECDVVVDAINRAKEIVDDLEATKKDIDSTYEELEQAVETTQDLIDSNNNMQEAETERQSNEESRIEAESERQSTFDSLKEAMDSEINKFETANIEAIVEDNSYKVEITNKSGEVKTSPNLLNSLSIGTVEATDSGEPPSASITGDFGNQKLNLQLPKGEKGDRSSLTPTGSTSIPVYINNDGLPQAISYTLGNACTRSYTTSVTSGSSSLVTSGAVYSALSNTASYEEGTWTPHFWLTSTKEITDYSARYGRYKKIGKVVFLDAQIYFPSTYSTNHYDHTTYSCVAITGFPFIPDHVLPVPACGLIVTGYKRSNTTTGMTGATYGESYSYNLWETYKLTGYSGMDGISTPFKDFYDTYGLTGFYFIS